MSSIWDGVENPLERPKIKGPPLKGNSGVKCSFCSAPATTEADDGEGNMIPACDDCRSCLAADMFITDPLLVEMKDKQ